jgi:quercetin dioxygenase-like cupin family protein
MTLRHIGAVRTDPGYRLTAGEGPAWWFLDTRMTVKADGARTGGACALLEFSAPPGFGPPWHVDHGEDEAVLVLAGSMRVAYGGQQWDARPGSFVFLPREVPYAFMVTSAEPTVGLQLTSPAGFGDFIAETGQPAGDGLRAPAPPDVEGLAAAAARHRTEITGRPLGLVGDPAETPRARRAR